MLSLPALEVDEFNAKNQLRSIFFFAKKKSGFVLRLELV